MNNTKIASLYIIISALSFSIMEVSVKISGENIPIMEQVFSRNFITLFISIFVMIKNKEKIFPDKKNIPAVFFRALSGYLGIIAYFYATNNMVLANASVLQKTSPFWASLFAFIIIKEKVFKIQWIALIVAAIGSILIIKPSMPAMNAMNSNMFTSIVALSSAVFAGLSYSIIGYLKGKESNALIIFYFSLLSCLFSSIHMKSFVIPNLFETIMLLMIGIFAGFGQFFLTMAYKKAPVSSVSIFNYAGVIFSYLFSVFMFKEKIDIYSIIGMILTVSAALIVYAYKNGFFKRQKL